MPHTFWMTMAACRTWLDLERTEVPLIMQMQLFQVPPTARAVFRTPQGGCFMARCATVLKQGGGGSRAVLAAWPFRCQGASAAVENRVS